ncbi:MAG TPA: hypothetical protein VGY48_15240 [Vicinamibacterales bacterium]|jgi:hypothetical protein|nr:hypothetical protein [Vicinamibacterales bacterium]
MLKPGDEISVVVQNGRTIIRAKVRGFVSDEVLGFTTVSERFGWDTPWQASGYCYDSDEGVTWVHGYVDEPACRALLVAYALGKGAAR